MNLSNLHTRVQQVKSDYDVLQRTYESNLSRLDELGSQISKIREEQALLETSRTTLESVKKILTKSSLEYCEKLATYAVRSIFNLQAEVKYSATDGKFYLCFEDGMNSDIAGDEGGGHKVVISLILNIYLVIKTGARRVLFFDEQWTNISSEYFEGFIVFIRQLCKELNFEIFLVTHDERITLDMVDSAYLMEHGVSKRIK